MNNPRRKKRQVNGILILNKPAGGSSNQVLQRVKRIYQASKAGHTGSLDPFATGVLPICFGEATKFSQFLLDSNKAYQAKVQLGVVTETGDCTGKIVSEHDVPDLTAEEIELVLAQFRGPQMQVPSMYSALKHQGKPLYEYARKGIEVPRPARSIVISELLLGALGPDTFEISVACSKGTYIRSLVEDIGKQIGCGAHVLTLDRTLCGPFKKSESVTIEQLEELSSSDGAIDQLLLPTSNAVPDFSLVQLDQMSTEKIMQGQQVEVVNIPGSKLPHSGMVKLFMGECFLGVGEITDINKLSPKRLVHLPNLPVGEIELSATFMGPS